MSWPESIGGQQGITAPPLKGGCAPDIPCCRECCLSYRPVIIPALVKVFEAAMVIRNRHEIPLSLKGGYAPVKCSLPTLPDIGHALINVCKAVIATREKHELLLPWGFPFPKELQTRSEVIPRDLHSPVPFRWTVARLGGFVLAHKSCAFKGNFPSGGCLKREIRTDRPSSLHSSITATLLSISH